MRTLYCQRALVLFSCLEDFPLCSFWVLKHAFQQEGLACSSAVSKQFLVFPLGQVWVLTLWSSLTFLVCPYVLPVSSHILLLSLQRKGHWFLLCLCRTWHTGFPACNRALNHYGGSRISTEMRGFQHSLSTGASLILPAKYNMAIWDEAVGEQRWSLCSAQGGAKLTAHILACLLGTMRWTPGLSLETLTYVLCFFSAKPNDVRGVVQWVISSPSFNHLHEYFDSYCDIGWVEARWLGSLQSSSPLCGTAQGDLRGGRNKRGMELKHFPAPMVLSAMKPSLLHPRTILRLFPGHLPSFGSLSTSFSPSHSSWRELLFTCSESWGRATAEWGVLPWFPEALVLTHPGRSWFSDLVGQLWSLENTLMWWKSSSYKSV